MIDAEGLFPRSTTWIGFRRDAVLRRYMFDFIRLFATHVTEPQMNELRRTRTQEKIDQLFKDTALPLRKGCGDDVTVAA